MRNFESMMSDRQFSALLAGCEEGFQEAKLFSDPVPPSDPLVIDVVMRSCEEQGSYGMEYNSKALGVAATPTAFAEKFIKGLTEQARLSDEEQEDLNAACEKGFEAGLSRSDDP